MNLPSFQQRQGYVIWVFALLTAFRFQSGSAFNPSTMVSSAFIAVSQLNNTIKYGVIRSSQRGSYRGCAAACLKEVHCRFFSYNQDTAQCELCNGSISTNETKIKFMYYRKSGGIEGWLKHNGDTSPWIRVDFNGVVTITGLITQGRGDDDQWVAEYSVTYSDDGQSWNHVTGAGDTPIKFPGNEDRHTLVTTRFPVVVRTRILRIHPTVWENYCSMRFEVIGCYT